MKVSGDCAEHGRARMRSSNFVEVGGGGRTDRTPQCPSCLHRNTTAAWSTRRDPSAMRHGSHRMTTLSSFLENCARTAHIIESAAAIFRINVDRPGALHDNVYFETFAKRVQRCFANTVVLRQAADPDTSHPCPAQ